LAQIVKDTLSNRDREGLDAHIRPPFLLFFNRSFLVSYSIAGRAATRGSTFFGSCWQRAKIPSLQGNVEDSLPNTLARCQQQTRCNNRLYMQSGLFYQDHLTPGNIIWTDQ